MVRYKSRPVLRKKQSLMPLFVKEEKVETINGVRII
jgi:hypothetical protein